MASPAVASSSAGGQATATTTIFVGWGGSAAAGDLLIAHVRFGGAPGTVTFTGWTLLGTSTADASDDQEEVYYKKADGSEGTGFNGSCGTAIKYAYTGLRITGAADPATRAPEITTVAIGTTGNPDSPLIAPTGGSKDYLFVSFVGWDGRSATGTATLSGYTVGSLAANGTSGTGGSAGSNCYAYEAYKQATAASEDPPVWTGITATPNSGWMAFTVAVHPPAAGAKSLLDVGGRGGRRSSLPLRILR